MVTPIWVRIGVAAIPPLRGRRSKTERREKAGRSGRDDTHVRSQLWGREKKMAIIRLINPKFRDLSEDFPR
jgi:hypothetical protein